jgi:hypothetical protein
MERRGIVRLEVQVSHVVMCTKVAEQIAVQLWIEELNK